MKRITEHLTPKQYLARFLLTLTALFGLYLILAWSSYTPLDNAWSTSGFETETINKAGRFGAWLIDLFFVLWGDAGNLLPFIIFFVPLYLLCTKALCTLTPWRILLRLVGFVLLFVGLSMAATLFLSNMNYYPGGVIGGNLMIWVYPMLGKWGCIALGGGLVILGFILCAGFALIDLLIRFYRWVAMKNTTQENVTEPQYQLDELERIVILPLAEMERTTTVAEMDSTNGHSANEDSVGEMSIESSGAFNGAVPPSHLIHISGLNAENQGESIDSAGRLTPFDHSQSAEMETLPKVVIATPSLISESMPVSAEMSSNLPNTKQDQERPQESAVDFELVSDSRNEFKSVIPNVSLARELANDVIVNHKETVPLYAENEADLAEQFAAREQQRLADMEKRAKATEAEEALKIILADSENDAPNIKEANRATDKVTDKATEPTNTAPYDNTLIHPAFQLSTEKAEKPTTPLPSLDLLKRYPPQTQEITQEEIIETSQRIEQQLRNFHINAAVKNVLVGPVVTRYELELQPGVKASKVTNIDSDLARALMFRAIRVAEVIPGKPYIGIETPNTHRQMVPLRDVLDSNEFKQSASPLSMALGKDISGKPVVVDLAKMPHLLVAGSTGSGKSVGVNTMILSLLFRVQPEDVKFIMIDPKVVELSIYDNIPHLLTPVVTDMKKAANALRWCVDEMERRYQLLSALRVRNIEGYNEKITEYEALNMPIPDPLWRPGDTMDNLRPSLKKLSYIVVVVDEFADLMMVAGKQIEELIARLAQKARAIGIHLILATQRPSVDVITGLIKANIPSRIAFTVTSKIDSRTILDQSGAEALLGRGDMLYSGQGAADLIRVHGAFMSDDEVARVADNWRARGKPDYIDGILDNTDEENAERESSGGDLDPLFDEVLEFVLNTGTTSASAVQRKFSVGFNRAARIMDQMEEQGIVSPLQNGKREILIRN